MVTSQTTVAFNQVRFGLLSNHLRFNSAPREREKNIPLTTSSNAWFFALMEEEVPNTKFLFAYLLFAGVVFAGCATTEQTKDKAKRFLDYEGVEVVAVDEAVAREAAANALSTLGYQVVVSEPGVVATSPMVISSGSVGVGATDGTIGIASTGDWVCTRAMELRFETLPDGQTRIKASPHVVYGKEDVTEDLFANSLRNLPEREHLREMFSKVRHFVEIKSATSAPASPTIDEALQG